MTWRTTRAALLARSIGRWTKLNLLLQSIASKRGYEEGFHAAMLGSVAPGDCVWDVGSNVGVYAVEFSKRVGLEGRVFAFEPSPKNVTELRARVGADPCVVVVPAALGAEDRTVRLEQGEDAVGATSRVIDGAEGPGRASIEVRMARGDSVLREGVATAPTVIKIDTEGFELDVMQGLGDILSNPSLRMVCVEVHFALLKRRGQARAPAMIERMLQTAGFSVEWTDASHLVARRRS